MTKIECTKFIGFTDKEKIDAKKSIALLEIALNDEAFQKSVLQWRFMGTTMSNEAILDRLLSGSDLLDEREDFVINLACSMYSRLFSKVIAWVNPGFRMIHFNRRRWGNEQELARTILHEYAHLLGFHHNSATDYGSVPYSFGLIFKTWYFKHREESILSRPG